MHPSRPAPNGRPRESALRWMVRWSSRSRLRPLAAAAAHIEPVEWRHTPACHRLDSSHQALAGPTLEMGELRDVLGAGIRLGTVAAQYPAASDDSWAQQWLGCKQ